jgi:GxxExxY protein
LPAEHAEGRGKDKWSGETALDAGESGMLIYHKETYALIGACFSVYREKGCGFLEGVYQECLEIELEHLGIPFVSDTPLALSYRGRELKQVYRADFICYGKIIIEIKAVSDFSDQHRAQLINYLHATGLELGLLVNFGYYPKLEYERIANTRGR